MRHIFTILCSKVSIDRQSNNASLFDIIERIELEVPAGTQRPITFGFSGDLVTLWGRNDFNIPGSGYARTRLLSPDNQVLAEFFNEVELQSAPRNRLMGHLNGLKVQGTGWHHFQVSQRDSPDADWEIVHEYPLEIIVNEKPQP